jgi:aminoglycoside/choline kinase family phosphotransferase
MSSAKQVISKAFESSAADRLARFITQQGITSGEVVPLTPDASTRKYYRINWKKSTAIAAVYAEPFDPEFHPYLDVTRLFLACDLPVPEVYTVDGPAGIIVQEDLGDQQLFQVYDSESEDRCDEYKEEAIALIAKIQKATQKAYDMHSIASKLAFDEAKLSWELEFFFEHYFGSLRAEKLRHAETAELKAELNDIAAELSAAPRVLCHRDYHAANLMIDKK